MPSSSGGIQLDANFELRGLRMGSGRQPLSEKHRDALASLRRELAGLLAEAELDAQ